MNKILKNKKYHPSLRKKKKKVGGEYSGKEQRKCPTLASSGWSSPTCLLQWVSKSMKHDISMGNKERIEFQGLPCQLRDQAWSKPLFKWTSPWTQYCPYIFIFKINRPTSYLPHARTEVEICLVKHFILLLEVRFWVPTQTCLCWGQLCTSLGPTVIAELPSISDPTIRHEFPQRYLPLLKDGSR